MAVSLEWIVQISASGNVWKPKVVTVGSDSCARLDQVDFGLVSLIAGVAGIKGLKFKQRPSLCNIDGFVELKDARNKAQADEIDPGRRTAPKKLFGDNGHGTKKVRRTLVEIAELRDNPQMFAVDVADEGESPMLVRMQRPIKMNDDVIINLDKESIQNMIDFIVRRGVTADELVTRRTYGSSGKKGVWKFGKQFYAKGEAGLRKVDVVRADGDGDTDGDDCSQGDQACDGNDMAGGVMSLADLPSVDA